MSLAELKLTMGCDEPPSAACLASGGKTLGVDRMIYGTLTQDPGAGLRAEPERDGCRQLHGAVRSVNAELSADALADGAVQATAKDLVLQVLGPVEVAPAAVPAVAGAPRPKRGAGAGGQRQAGVGQATTRRPGRRPRSGPRRR
jgi:hypothetical protein